jgi:hypothetical protein
MKLGDKKMFPTSKVRTKINWMQILITVVIGLIFTHFETNRIIDYIRHNKHKIEELGEEYF